MNVQEISKTSKENVWIWGEDIHTGAVVTIDSATFEVFDADASSVQGSAAATLSDNGTATPDIYGLVDCTAAGFTAEEYYEVLFIMTIGTEEISHSVHIKCVEKKS
jgi:hypothetical protein